MHLMCKCPYVPLHLTVLSTYLCMQERLATIIDTWCFSCSTPSFMVDRNKSTAFKNGLANFSTCPFAGLLSLLKVAPLVRRHTKTLLLTRAPFMLQMSFIIFVIEIITVSIAVSSKIVTVCAAHLVFGHVNQRQFHLRPMPDWTWRNYLCMQ